MSFPWGSVLALYNIYIYDLPSLFSKKYAYAGDLALLHFSNNCKMLEEFLRQGMTTRLEYIKNWRPKLSHLKTMATAYHINNREANREFAVHISNFLPFYTVLTYLEVKLDRSLTSHHHKEALPKKLKSSVALLRRFAGSE